MNAVESFEIVDECIRVLAVYAQGPAFESSAPTLKSKKAGMALNSGGTDSWIQGASWLTSLDKTGSF